MAAKRPPPTRAAIDIEGPTEARSTSSERRPAMSPAPAGGPSPRGPAERRADEAVFDVTARRRPGLLRRRQRSRAPPEALAVGQPEGVRALFFQLRSWRSSSRALRSRWASLCRRLRSPAASASRTRCTARREAMRQSKGRSSSSSAPASRAAPASRRLAQRAITGTSPCCGRRSWGRHRPPSPRRAMSARTTSGRRRLNVSMAPATSSATTISNPELASQRDASLRVEASRPARSARRAWRRETMPGAPSLPSLRVITGSAGSATFPR